MAGYMLGNVRARNADKCICTVLAACLTARDGLHKGGGQHFICHGAQDEACQQIDSLWHIQLQILQDGHQVAEAHLHVVCGHDLQGSCEAVRVALYSSGVSGRAWAGKVSTMCLACYRGLASSKRISAACDNPVYNEDLLMGTGGRRACAHVSSSF